MYLAGLVGRPDNHPMAHSHHTTLAVGGWFLFAAWALYRADYDLNSGAVVMRVYLFFVWQMMAAALVVLAFNLFSWACVNVVITRESRARVTAS